MYMHIFPSPSSSLQVAREGKHGGDSGGGAVFRKLSKHLDEQFAKDFPFYLLVAYRVHRYRQHQLIELCGFRGEEGEGEEEGGGGGGGGG